MCVRLSPLQQYLAAAANASSAARRGAALAGRRAARVPDNLNGRVARALIIESARLPSCCSYGTRRDARLASVPIRPAPSTRVRDATHADRTMRCAALLGHMSLIMSEADADA